LELRVVAALPFHPFPGDLQADSTLFHTTASVAHGNPVLNLNYCEAVRLYRLQALLNLLAISTSHKDPQAAELNLRPTVTTPMLANIVISDKA
jgi:hypothetical protein